jgi:triacylglycerol lipase
VEVRASHLGMAIDPRVLEEVVVGLGAGRDEAAPSAVEVDRGEIA